MLPRLYSRESITPFLCNLSSKRLRFPKELDVLITDTVGFIRNLPKDLLVAFRATLEELEGADILLHVIDISNHRYSEQIKAVEKILTELSLHKIPQVRALNKTDLLSSATVSQLAEKLHGIPICARQKSTLLPLIDHLATMIEEKRLIQPVVNTS